MTWYGLVWHGMVGYGIRLYDTVRRVRYGIVRHGIVWYGTVRMARCLRCAWAFVSRDSPVERSARNNMMVMTMFSRYISTW